MTRTDRARGRAADTPTEIPKRGWRDVVARVRAEAKQDNVTLLSAGVAFYSLLALVPAMIASISIYGLVADPSKVEGQVIDALKAAPREVRDMIASQLESIAGSQSAAVLATIIGALVALWSASNGVGNLVTALNVAYDEQETRGWIKRKLLALGFTIGGLVFFAVAFGLIALLPPILADLDLGPAARWIAGGVRWIVLLGGMIVALGIIYRFGPDRADAKWRWVTPGAAFAALMWIVASIGFSIYTANFGKYNETYGSLGAVVVVMLWLWLTALSVVLGAEWNAEIERQTAKDTTTGDEKPLGARGAYAADTIGETAEEVKARKESGEPMGGGKEGPEPARDRTPALVSARTGGDAPRESETAHSTGAVPAMIGLSALGAVLRGLRGRLERRAPSRT